MIVGKLPEESKVGSDWQSDELDLIVADYFAMLAADLAGQPYVKSKHNAILMGQTGRTQGSVEFKHQNISAVLDELGMPWIPGYKPRSNYQNAILDAIDRFLTRQPVILEPVLNSPPAPLSTSEVFVAPPALKRANGASPERLQRLIRKFDPVERDHRNRLLGNAGEAFIVGIERRRLTESNRADLAGKVRWVAAEDGDGAGYDVLSFSPKGDERLIEVKTTNGSARTPFFLTRNECDLAAERPADWRIYRVHLFAREPRVFTIAPPLENTIRLTAETWRASF
jgi:hypothetical protein